MINLKGSCLLSIESLFVIAPARLYLPSIHATLTTLAATFHLTKWYAIELCFLFKVEASNDEFFTTLSLSQSTLVGPARGTPNMRNLNLNAVICSIQTLAAINLLENVLASTVFWRLLNHTIGAIMRNNMNQVWLLQVTLFAACDKLTYVIVEICLPLGFGHMWGGGNCSLASWYCSLNTSTSSPWNHEGSMLGFFRININSEFGILLQKCILDVDDQFVEKLDN